MPFDPNHEQQLFEKKFEVNFPNFYLLNPNNLNNHILKGFGWVRHIAEDIFDFRLFVVQKNKKFEHSSSIKDESSDEKGYHYFRGIDEYGSLWKFNTLNIGFQLPGSSKGTYSIYGKFETLEQISHLPEKSGSNYLEFIFSDKFLFPYNKSEKIESKRGKDTIRLQYESTIDYCQNNLKIRSLKSENLIYIIFEKDRFHENYDIRILESLKFITGQQLRPGIIRKKKNTQIHSLYFAENNDNNYKIEPPIWIDKYPNDKYEYSWVLFCKILSSISKYKGQLYTPIGAEINGLIGAGPAFFETKLLNIGVRVEGILNILYPKLGVPNDIILDNISRLVQYISDFKDNNPIKIRLISSLNNMKKSRAKDRLLELKKRGVINKEQYDSWSKLRNQSAHAVRDRGKDWFEKSYNRYSHVLEMLYRIIFYSIKYNGIYTSYVTKGHKDKKFHLYQAD